MFVVNLFISSSEVLPENRTPVKSGETITVFSVADLYVPVTLNVLLDSQLNVCINVQDVFCSDLIKILSGSIQHLFLLSIVHYKNLFKNLESTVVDMQDLNVSLT